MCICNACYCCCFYLQLFSVSFLVFYSFYYIINTCLDFYKLPINFNLGYTSSYNTISNLKGITLKKLI